MCKKQMRPNSKGYESFSIGGTSEVSKKETGGKNKLRNKIQCNTEK